MKIKKYHFRYVSIGKNRVYLRYMVTKDHKPYFLNISCDLTLPKSDVKKLNDGTFENGLIKKSITQIKSKYQEIVEWLFKENSEYPTPDEIRNYYDTTEAQLELSVLIDYYMLTRINNKHSSSAIVYNILKLFEDYINTYHKKFTIKNIVNKNMLQNFETHLMTRRYPKKYALITLYNYKAIVLKFLNYLAERYGVKLIEMSMHQPKYSNKFHLTKEDVEKLLKYKPKTDREKELIDIIILNKNIGLRINEILNIQTDNCVVLPDCIEVRFAETKKSKERTILVIQPEGMEVMKRHLQYPKLWMFYTNYNLFNRDLKKVGKEVFQNETTKVFKINTAENEYQEVLKSDALSSHAFRRLAIETNIVDFGIDVARTYSGHADYQTVTRNYANFLQKEDLKKLLLKKK